MKYLVEIQGGIGPDVWDQEHVISGADFRDAANQAAAWAEEMHGIVVALTLTIESFPQELNNETNTK